MRSRDVLYTVAWTVKTETSSYLRDVSIPPRCPYTWTIYSSLGGSNVRDISPRRHHTSETSLNPRVYRVDFIPNSYPHNSLILEINGNKRIIFFLSIEGASFQQFKHLNFTASFSNDDVSSVPPSLVIMKRYFLGSAFNSGTRKARLFIFENFEMTAPFGISDT
jgi:hypothetical protein